MTLTKSIIMSGVDYFGNQEAINPYYKNESIDLNQARREHAVIASKLREAGVNVITVKPPTDSQDGLYTANWALVRGKRAVLARLPLARKTEEAWAEKILTVLGIEVYHIPEGLKFSGQGDALPCGQYLFSGKTYRSDVEAQVFAAKTLGYTRIQLETLPQRNKNGETIINPTTGWPDSFFYDIDLALGVIRDPTDTEKGFIVYCPDAFTPASRKLIENLPDIEVLRVSQREAKQGFACNLISTGDTVIMSARAPRLSRELRARGFTTSTPKISELAKGGGYIRCLGLSINE